MGEADSGGVGGETGMCRVVGGRARLGGGVYGGGVTGGEGVVEVEVGVGGSSVMVDEDDGDEGALVGVGGRVP